MPRAKRVFDPKYPVHVSGRSRNRDWYELPMNLMWSIFSDYLYLARSCFGLQIHSFVLMNNHYHLLVSAPNGNLPEAMNYFLRETSRVVGFESSRINQVFGGPYHPTIIKSEHHFQHAYKYVYRNPVDAGLCENVESYPYSTLRGLLGFDKAFIPLEEDTILFDRTEKTLEWLNRSYKETDRDEIRKALRKHDFSFSKGKRSEYHVLDNRTS